MIDELNKIINLLEMLNSQVNTTIITAEEISEGKNNIVHFQNDLKLLINTIKKSEDAHVSMTETFVYMNEYFSNIIQDLQNIEEIIISSAGRYRDYKDKIERTKS